MQSRSSPQSPACALPDIIHVLCFAQNKTRELFVVDPAQCREALSKLFKSVGRNQDNEMADASEALTDVFEALHLCFVPHEPTQRDAAPPDGSEDSIQSSGSFWQPSVVSDTFGMHVTETQECSTCRTKSPGMKFTKFFQMVGFPSSDAPSRDSRGGQT